jgi:ribosomal protein L11 methyltransferase
MRNGVAIPVGQGSAEDVPGRFDVVIANIVSPVLQAIAPHLAARLSGGGTLLVAGISDSAEAATRDAFARARLSVVDRTERDDWVALALRR